MVGQRAQRRWRQIWLIAIGRIKPRIQRCSWTTVRGLMLYMAPQAFLFGGYTLYSVTEAAEDLPSPPPRVIRRQFGRQAA
jgi:hypothetical protein